MPTSSEVQSSLTRLLNWAETRRGFVVAVGCLAMVAAGLRFIRIAVPPERVFDEVYSPLFMWKFLHREAFFDVHPILAQLPHAVGLLLFGDTPLGWRFSPWLWGIFFILGIGAFGSFLTGRRLTGVLASLLAVLDISFFVYGRTGLPDMFLLATFVWAFALFFLCCRARTARGGILAALGSGILLGNLAATKWFGVGALALAWAWIGLALLGQRPWVRGQRTAGDDPHSGLRPKARGREFLPRIPRWLFPVMFLLVPVLVYFLWLIPVVGIPGVVRPAVGEELFRGSCTFGQVQNPREQPPTTWLTRARHWHCTVWNYHAYLEARHPYASPWWSWPILKHPVLFYLDASPDAPRRISATGTPVLWWGGFATVFLTIFSLPLRFGRSPHWLGDETAASVFVDLWLLLGIFGFWVPWAFIQRVAFHYHYFLSFTLTVVLLAAWLERLRHRPTLRPFVLAFLFLTFASFVYLYPTASALPAFWVR